VTHAWYRGEGAQTPWKGETDPNYTDFHEDGKYTWVKAPRYNGSPIQVGPLANVLVGYASGHPLTRKWTDTAFKTISSVHGFKMTPDDLQSTMGRYLARGIRSAMLSDSRCSTGNCSPINILKVTTPLTTAQFPSHECEGVRYARSSARRAFSLGNHRQRGFFQLPSRRATTWNASPRDEKGVPDPMRLRSLRIQWWTAETAGSAPYRTLLRSVHGMRVSHARCERPRDRAGESVMSTSFADTTAGQPLRRIAVLGLGNVLLGDDGFGPMAVEMFRSLYECDSNVEILDLGTPGLDLAPYLYDADLL